MDIPDEAVEAAEEALFAVFERSEVDFWVERNGDRHIIEGRVNITKAIRKVLEAAAPRMLAAELDPELALEVATENYRQWLDEQQ